MIHSVACPGTEGHGGNTKIMFFADKDGLILYCPKHKHIKFRFRKNGRSIYFDDVQVTASEMPDGKRHDCHFDNEPLTVLAYGKFERKDGKCNHKK